MKRVLTSLYRIDDLMVAYLQPRVFSLVRISIGIVYIIFGALKYFPNYSPAEELAVQTIDLITLGVFSGKIALYSLAAIETLIGIMLVINYKVRLIVLIALWHMLCTFLPMILLPGATYTDSPYSLSLVGQYILKNLVVISALLALYINDKQSA